MPLDPIPASSQSDGRWKIAYVPKVANPLSVAILNGATAKNLTYSFTPDGFPYAATQALINDPRLSLVQVLSRMGKVTETLSLKYVESTSVDSASLILTDLLEGYFVIRRGKDNATAWTVADIVYVITFQLGYANPDPAIENGVDTMSQPVAFIDATKRRVPLVA